MLRVFDKSENTNVTVRRYQLRNERWMESSSVPVLNNNVVDVKRSFTIENISSNYETVCLKLRFVIQTCLWIKVNHIWSFLNTAISAKCSQQLISMRAIVSVHRITIQIMRRINYTLYRAIDCLDSTSPAREMINVRPEVFLKNANCINEQSGIGRCDKGIPVIINVC